MSTVGIPLDAGTMPGYLARPAGTPAAGVVIIQEIFGVNAAMRRACDDFAARGYLALAPDLYWRLEPGIEHDYSEAGIEAAFGDWRQFDRNLGESDLIGALAFLKSQADCTGRAAFVGFCLGGELAMRSAPRCDVDAVVSFYGVRPQEYLPLFGSLHCPVQFHCGTEDHHVPVEVIEAVRDAAAGKPDAEVFTYDGARHGFFNKIRAGSVYAPEHAALAEERVLELFGRALT